MKFIDERLYRHFVGELVKNLTDENISEYAELEKRAWLWSSQVIGIRCHLGIRDRLFFKVEELFDEARQYNSCDVDAIVDENWRVLYEGGPDVDIIDGRFIVRAGDLLDRLIFERKGFAIAEVSDVQD